MVVFLSYSSWNFHQFSEENLFLTHLPVQVNGVCMVLHRVTWELRLLLAPAASLSGAHARLNTGCSMLCLEVIHWPKLALWLCLTCKGSLEVGNASLLLSPLKRYNFFLQPFVNYCNFFTLFQLHYYGLMLKCLSWRSRKAIFSFNITWLCTLGWNFVCCY